MIKFNHFNFNVLDLDKSLAFYKEALELWSRCGTKEASDGSFKLVYLGDGLTGVPAGADLAEGPGLSPTTWGSASSTWPFVTDRYDELLPPSHKEMGCVCFENPGMGIYFIADPDGYWIEIVPEKK